MLTLLFDLLAVVVPAGASFCAALGALVLYNRFDAVRLARTPAPDPDAKAVFLFSDRRLTDASASAREMMDAGPQVRDDWARLSAILVPAGLSLPPDPDAVMADQPQRMMSKDLERDIRIERIGDCVRITVTPQRDSDPQVVKIEALAWQATQDELATLRASTDELPYLVWRQGADGTIIWANRAYFTVIDAVNTDSPYQTWPPMPVFDVDALARVAGDGMPARLALHTGDGAGPQWFECTARPLGDGHLFSAINVDDAVSAESHRQAFTQTLAKTFSHLTAGLAVFDKSRRLVLFNPALTDLTTLSAEFLAARPTLFTLLDRLRDKQMIPEPKDYIGWRDQMAELEAAAQHGTYSEIWSLPAGRTFRVSGRPHPDGAVAFIFEDISAEMMLTRRFRSELELGQSVLDSFEEAIAVFSRDGELTLSNAPYDRMWRATGGGELLAEPMTVTEASRFWMAGSRPTPIWGEVRDFVLHGRERTAWAQTIQLTSGIEMLCRIQPLAGGATLIGFSTATTDRLGEQIDLIRA
ncbi:MAG: PAS-domain containing protein [Pseudomonadota bacterium]